MGGALSHHDPGWGKEKFAAESSYTDMAINRALDRIGKYPDSNGPDEYQSYIYGYLKAHPGRYAESRQSIYGEKWVDAVSPGFKSRIYCNTDVSGRGPRMPQILKKAGCDSPYVRRISNLAGSHPNEFKKWEVLDGLCANVFFMCGYSHDFGVYMSPGQKNGILENAYVPARLKDCKTDQVKNPLPEDALPLVYRFNCFNSFDFSGDIRVPNRHSGLHGLPGMEYGIMKEKLASVFAKKGNSVSERRVAGQVVPWERGLR